MEGNEEDAKALKATRVSEAEALAVERHQKINMVWEYTQAYMAIIVITSVLVTLIYLSVTENQNETAVAIMANLTYLVAGFYFGRTNHTRPTGEN